MQSLKTTAGEEEEVETGESEKPTHGARVLYRLSIPTLHACDTRLRPDADLARDSANISLSWRPGFIPARRKWAQRRPAPAQPLYLDDGASVGRAWVARLRRNNLTVVYTAQQKQTGPLPEQSQSVPSWDMNVGLQR
jgi:hypothetical protein